MPITVLTEAELRQCVRLDLELVDAIADTFTASVSRRVVVAPSLHIGLTEADGEVDARTAWLPGLPSLRSRSARSFSATPSAACRGRPVR